MSGAVWMLLYDIADADREVYLDWFHEVHIPEKLARPGYLWAAHYRVVDAAARGDGARGYVAFFGGESTRTFYDPSPAQLKLRQNDETREMMGCRQAGSAVVLCEEWASEGASEGATGAVDTGAIRLACYDAGGHDEALSAWLVQEHAPRIDAAGAAVRKWLGSSGSPRHVVVEEYGSVDAWADVDGTAVTSDRGRRVLEQVEEPVGSPRLATRLWPFGGAS